MKDYRQDPTFMSGYPTTDSQGEPTVLSGDRVVVNLGDSNHTKQNNWAGGVIIGAVSLEKGSTYPVIQLDGPNSSQVLGGPDCLWDLDQKSTVKAP